MARASGTAPTLDLRPLIDLVGVKQVIDQLGLRRVLDAVGHEEWVSQLTPEQREEVKRLLQGRSPGPFLPAKSSPMPCFPGGEAWTAVASKRPGR